MGDTELPNNTLHKTKHTSGSILNYRVGLAPIATSFLVGWIERNLNRPATSLARSYLTR